MPITPDLEPPVESRKTPCRDRSSPTLRRNRIPRPLLPSWKLRMIYDMIVSRSLTVTEMAEAAKCDEESINDICKFLYILAFREDDNSPPLCPIININILPADTSIAPSISISATPRAVDFYVTGNITVSVSTDGAIKKQAWPM